MKKVIIFLLGVIVGAVGMFSVNKFLSNKSNDEGASNPIKQTVDLTGTWRQINNEDPDAYHEAIIKDGVIEIYWVSNGGDTKSLYWAGSYEAPDGLVGEYSWTSVNDTSKTDGQLLASRDETKTINYKDGQIYYEATALSVTTTRKLERVN